MKRFFVLLFVVISFLLLGLQPTPKIDSVSYAMSEDCTEQQWVCGEPYERNGQKYQDCYCPITGQTIARPVF